MESCLIILTLLSAQLSGNDATETTEIAVRGKGEIEQTGCPPKLSSACNDAVKLCACTEGNQFENPNTATRQSALSGCEDQRPGIGS